MDADFRLARASDIDTLLSIENSVFETDRISRRAFHAHIRSRTAALLVACRGVAVVGYALVLFHRARRAARLYSIAVAPAQGSAGLGRALLAAAEAASAARGCAALRLEVREDNGRAVQLYRRAGYRGIGRRETYYEDGTAALLFEKDLKDIRNR